jgi:hypothetical protein
MKLRNSQVIKGIAFAGCSFTWGQGLWYYSNLPSIREQQLNSYDANLVDFTHRKHSATLRFPRLVAEHFGTWELVHHSNGGSLDKILDYWGEIAFNIADHNTRLGMETKESLEFQAHNPSDFSYFVLQCTNWTRTNVTIVENGQEIGPIQRWEWFSKYKDNFNNYLKSRNLTLDQYFEECYQEDVNRYKSLLMYIESLGIKTAIMTWPEELVRFIGNDEWLAERMIRFDYLQTTYNSIEKLLDDNPGMTLDTDYQNFEVPPTDNHPSKLCHRVIAGAVVEHIKEIK